MSQHPTRYQLRLGGTADRHIREMCEKGDVSAKDLILDALAIVQFAMQAVEKGKQFGIWDPQDRTFTALLTPVLQNVANRKDHKDVPRKSDSGKRSR